MDRCAMGCEVLDATAHVDLRVGRSDACGRRQLRRASVAVERGTAGCRYSRAGLAERIHDRFDGIAYRIHGASWRVTGSGWPRGPSWQAPSPVAGRTGRRDLIELA